MSFLKLFIIPFLLLMVLAQTQIAQSNILKANISCLDCQPNYDFSGNMILVKCEKEKKLRVAITEGNGSFETELPSELAAGRNWKCIAKLVGGGEQLYASRKDMSSTVIKAINSNSFTLATALKFSTRKQNHPIINNNNNNADSKTIDLPLPSQWGFPPLSFYLPLLPIIGIP